MSVLLLGILPFDSECPGCAEYCIVTEYFLGIINNYIYRTVGPLNNGHVGWDITYSVLWREIACSSKCINNMEK